MTRSAAPSPRASFLPRTVIVFGLVSFMNDAASEMVTPILPLFLTATLGAGPAAVGLIEGLADATASILKLVSGRLADRGWRHKRLVIGGYGLSNTVRPLIGLALNWTWVLALRFLDRVGKGIRTSPRDALVSGAVDASARGRAFGFHRAMDHAGAMLGPLLAFALLTRGVPMRTVFFVSVVPGILVMGLLWRGIPDAPPAAGSPPPRLAWRALDARVRALLVAAGGMAFATAPDAFLVLWAGERGLEVAWVPLLWSAAHGVRSVAAGVGGAASDRAGRFAVVTAGWTLRVALLVALAIAPSGGGWVWGLFLLWAAATASTEGAERAIVGDFAPRDQKATAFGLYHLLSGILALPGALLLGVLWQLTGMRNAFLASAALTATAAAALLVPAMVIHSRTRK